MIEGEQTLFGERGEKLKMKKGLPAVFSSTSCASGAARVRFAAQRVRNQLPDMFSG